VIQARQPVSGKMSGCLAARPSHGSNVGACQPGGVRTRPSVELWRADMSRGRNTSTADTRELPLGRTLPDQLGRRISLCVRVSAVEFSSDQRARRVQERAANTRLLRQPADRVTPLMWLVKGAGHIEHPREQRCQPP
jgi:hypothetical protein